MKKLTRKLFLSVCTLAICAVTLVSTTFAWYTTNTNVTADGLSAASASTGASSILISKTGTGDWAQAIDYSTKDGDTINTAGMVPLQAVLSDSKIILTECNLATTIGGTTATQGATALPNSGKYFTITVHVKTTALASDAAPVSIYLKAINIVNTTKVGDEVKLPEWDNLLSNKTGEGLGINPNVSKYSVDIIDALSLTTSWTTAISQTETHKAEVYDLANLVSKNSKDATSDQATDALAYYNSVMGTKITLPEQPFVKTLGTSGQNLLEVGKLTSAEPQISITLNIFLDGWDEFCYDACKGQSFSVDFEFTTDSEFALKY